jgi:hypothetical protein
MELEELTKALGLDTEETKDKAVILKKEYNAFQKSIHELEDKEKALNETIESNKQTLDRFNILVNAFGVDVNAKDFDEGIELAKEKIVKDAGGGTTPEEIKELKRNLTKANRQVEEHNKTIEDLTTQLNGEKTMRLNTVKRNTIRKSLESVHAVEPEMFVDMFFGKTKVEDDGKTCTIMGDDGVELSVADYIADWAKDHQNLIAAQPKGGAGSAGGNGGTQSNDVSPFMQALLNNKKASQTGGGGKSLSELFGA